MRAQPARATARAGRRHHRGVSLLEALVALGVTAVGLLGLLGIQSTLRLNSDVARQRTEAVRIAQEAVERWRAFAVVETTPGAAAFADIVTSADEQVAGYVTNTTYTLQRNVSAQDDQRHRRLQVSVEWVDRSGQTQNVSLYTVVAASPPELSGAITQRPNGSPAKQPQGRHPSIPWEAKDVGGGQSAFKPPGSGTVAWVFNNLTGLITGDCVVDDTRTSSTLTDADVADCRNNTLALPVSGTVRFATGAEMNAAIAENPSSSALNLRPDIALTSTGNGSPGYVCYSDAPATSVLALLQLQVRYFCAVTANAEGLWSGVLNLQPLAFSDNGELWPIAITGAGNYQVCRYTPASSNTQVIPNVQHPRRYVDVTTPLPHQNFLVIAAVNICPTDVAPDPAVGDFVNSNTLLHQP